jgi:aminoglycoside 6'-N-acetyltransferase I
MEIRIREREPRDRPGWIQLRAELWRDLSVDQHVEEVRRLEEQGALSAVWVAESDEGALVGFLELGLRSIAAGCVTSPVPYIEGWYVRDYLRGQGVGRSMMELAEHWSRKNGFRELASDSGLDNDLARTAHSDAGFTEVDRVICWRKTLGDQ